MKPSQFPSIIVAAIFSLITMSGCIPLLIGAAAGAGGITYAKGALVQNVDHTVSEVHKAGVAALKKLDLFVTEDKLDKHTAVIRAEYNDGQKIQVFIDALTERSSKITIRIGTFGDRAQSEIILDAIQKKL
jgi:hypothetical protein